MSVPISQFIPSHFPPLVNCKLVFMLPLETRPDSPGESGMQARDHCPPRDEH